MVVIQDVLNKYIIALLLSDKSSGKNIIWANDTVAGDGHGHSSTDEINIDIFNNSSLMIKPRVKRQKEEQEKRTRDSAEVYTPAWLCNIRNNLVDDKWFDRKNVFNTPNKHIWKVNKKRIEFSENGKTYMMRITYSSGHISNKKFVFVPKMDFKEEWKDQDLYEYFELDKDEIELIENTMRPLILDDSADIF